METIVNALTFVPSKILEDEWGLREFSGYTGFAGRASVEACETRDYGGIDEFGDLLLGFIPPENVNCVSIIWGEKIILAKYERARDTPNYISSNSDKFSVDRYITLDPEDVIRIYHSNLRFEPRGSYLTFVAFCDYSTRKALRALGTPR